MIGFSRLQGDVIQVTVNHNSTVISLDVLEQILTSNTVEVNELSLKREIKLNNENKYQTGITIKNNDAKEFVSSEIVESFFTLSLDKIEISDFDKYKIQD